jgi:hypothetical protein
MCILFVSTECPFTGLELTMPLSTLFNSSGRPSTEEAASSSQSYASSRSSITTMSSYSHGSSDSLNEMMSFKESSKVSISEHPIKHFRISTSAEADVAAFCLRAEDTAASDYLTAINTLTNILESNPNIEIGRCLDPTSPVPRLCKNLQIRHRSSSKRQTGYFDKCSKCTDVGRQWQESRGEVGITWEQLRESSNRGQKINKAETGMCSTRGCDGCRPTNT